MNFHNWKFSFLSLSNISSLKNLLPFLLCYNKCLKFAQIKDNFQAKKPFAAKLYIQFSFIDKNGKLKSIIGKAKMAIQNWINKKFKKFEN